MRLAFSPTRWLLAGAVLAIFALSTPAIDAAPLDPVSTELEQDDELGNDPDLINSDVELIQEGGGNAVPVVPPPPGFGPEGRKDLC